MKIVVVSDGDAVHGMGHLGRAQLLTESLRRRDCAVRLLVRSRTAADLIGDVDLFGATDLASVDVMVLDLPTQADELVRQARARGAAVFGLDYPGDEPLDAGVSMWLSDNRPNDRHVPTGLKFAILREEFGASLTPCRDDVGVLVALGGADVRGMSGQVAAKLVGTGFAVTVVMGAAAPITGDIAGATVVTAVSGAAMTALQASCRWAICNGGTTLLELLALNKACHVIPQNSGEEAFVRCAIPAGALLGIDDDIRVPTDDQIRLVAEAAHGIVDGNGRDRVCDLILAMA